MSKKDAPFVLGLSIIIIEAIFCLLFPQAKWLSGIVFPISIAIGLTLFFISMAGHENDPET
ncbi:MAG: hypothetical protein AB1721_01445 [Patescibacteria group bacterium]